MDPSLFTLIEPCKTRHPERTLYDSLKYLFKIHHNRTRFEGILSSFVIRPIPLSLPVSNLFFVYRLCNSSSFVFPLLVQSFDLTVHVPIVSPHSSDLKQKIRRPPVPLPEFVSLFPLVSTPGLSSGGDIHTLLNPTTPTPDVFPTSPLSFDSYVTRNTFYCLDLSLHRLPYSVPTTPRSPDLESHLTVRPSPSVSLLLVPPTTNTESPGCMEEDGLYIGS